MGTGEWVLAKMIGQFVDEAKPSNPDGEPLPLGEWVLAKYLGQFDEIGAPVKQ